MLLLCTGRAERQTTGYLRHGTVSLIAALDMKTGNIISRVQARHTQWQFLRDINAATSADLDLHLVFDNYARLRTLAISHYRTTNNQDPKPFAWTASASLILGKVSRLCGELL